jgi:hypothetical protein
MFSIPKWLSKASAHFIITSAVNEGSNFSTSSPTLVFGGVGGFVLVFLRHYVAQVYLEFTVLLSFPHTGIRGWLSFYY